MLGSLKKNVTISLPVSVMNYYWYITYMHTNYLVNGPQTWTSPLGSKMASMTLDPCAIRKQLIWDSGVLRTRGDATNFNRWECPLPWYCFSDSPQCGFAWLFHFQLHSVSIAPYSDVGSYWYFRGGDNKSRGFGRWSVQRNAITACCVPCSY